MVDKKEGVSNIGNTRWKYLDFANIYFAQGQLKQCNDFIDAFIQTLDEKTEAGKSVKKEFDDVYKNKINIESAVEEKVKNMGYLERKDFEDMARRELELETLQNLKSACWRISLQYGLFFE